MKAIIQRVKKAQVIVDNNIVGNINKGIVAFIGITKTDSSKEIE